MDFDDSNTVRGGYTPLVFQGNKLVAIGKREYSSAVWIVPTWVVCPLPLREIAEAPDR